jgi:hypothetical protein
MPASAFDMRFRRRSRPDSSTNSMSVGATSGLDEINANAGQLPASVAALRKFASMEISMNPGATVHTRIERRILR